ncbi:tyrosine-type recombinase/integrase [Bacteroidota bacterium]
MYLSKRKGIWYVFYRQPNRKKTCISCRTRRKSEALKFLTEFEKKLKERSLPKAVLLSDYIKEYLLKLKITHTKSSYGHAILSLNKFQEYLGKDYYLKEISFAMAEGFVFEVFKRSKYTSSLYYRNLKTAFNRAENLDYIEKNPFSKIKFPQIPEKQPAIINESELQLIVEEEKNKTLAGIYRIAFYTGMRLSEILNLKWYDIDFEQSMITISHKEDFTTKGKRERVVPMNSKIKEMLSTYEKDEDYIFCKEDGSKYNASYVSRSFKKVIRELKLDDDIHFHSLRHSFCSKLVARGVNIYLVKELAGHRNIMTTQRYTQLEKNTLNSNLDVLE